jgi:hypothetical protein
VSDEDEDEDEDEDDLDEDPEVAKFEDLAFAWGQAKRLLDAIGQFPDPVSAEDRRKLLERLEQEIDRGTLAAVGHVMIADADTEDAGIEAMARVAPLVVELRAMLPLGRRLLKRRGIA